MLYKKRRSRNTLIINIIITIDGFLDPVDGSGGVFRCIARSFACSVFETLFVMVVRMS